MASHILLHQIWDKIVHEINQQVGVIPYHFAHNYWYNILELRFTKLESIIQSPSTNLVGMYLKQFASGLLNKLQRAPNLYLPGLNQWRHQFEWNSLWATPDPPANQRGVQRLIPLILCSNFFNTSRLGKCSFYVKKWLFCWALCLLITLSYKG